MWVERRETLAFLKHSLQMAIQKAPSYYEYTPYGHRNKDMVSCPACKQAVRHTSAAMRSHVERHTGPDLAAWFMTRAYE